MTLTGLSDSVLTETIDAAARRQQKKAAAVASKSAAETQAADLARKRLAILQTKRTAVFEAARRTAFDVVKHGVYEDNVDPNGGEFLPGGKEAVEECKEAGINLEEETSNGPKSKSAKKKAKAKANKVASTSSSSPSTTFSSPELPTGFASSPTPSKPEASSIPSQTAGLFEGTGTNKKKGGKKQKKKGNNASNAPLPADATTSTPPPGAYPDTPTTNKSQEAAQTLVTDPRETLLHLVVQHGEKEMVEWLLSHGELSRSSSPFDLSGTEVNSIFAGAVPEERNSTGQTAFHLALILNHTSIVGHLLSEYTPPFPPPSYQTATGSPDVFYPLPKNQTLLSLALIGGAKDPVKVLDLVRLVMPFVGGKEVKLGWKKADFEQGRKGLKDWKWDSWEEIKWVMAERMQKLEFDGVSLESLSDPCKLLTILRVCSSLPPKNIKVVDLATKNPIPLFSLYPNLATQSPSLVPLVIYYAKQLYLLSLSLKQNSGFVFFFVLFLSTCKDSLDLNKTLDCVLSKCMLDAVFPLS